MSVSAVIDKSLFQAICSQPEPQRGRCWNELFTRYQIVIPFVLVEEVWTNYVKPGPKNRAVVREMVSTLTKMTSCWIDDEIEFVFKELVLRKRIKKLLPPPKQYTQRVIQTSPTDPDLNRWLEQTRDMKHKAIRQRIQEQNTILPVGKFVTVKNAGDLFQQYVRDQFAAIVASPARTKTLLEKLLGGHFRQRHPNFNSRIEKAFLDYSNETFTRYPITLNYIMTSMFYFYAPLCRIQSHPKTPFEKIIGSKRTEQLHNLEDQKYIVSALICDRLLTSDEGMRNLMKVFQESQLWKGKTVYIDPRKALIGQIPQLLN